MPCSRTTPFAPLSSAPELHLIQQLLLLIIVETKWLQTQEGGGCGRWGLSELGKIRGFPWSLFTRGLERYFRVRLLLWECMRKTRGENNFRHVQNAAVFIAVF